MTFDAQCTWITSEHMAFQGTRTQTKLWRKQSPQVSLGVPAQNKALHLVVKKVESWPSPIQRQLQEYQVKGDEEEGQTSESEIASTTSYATMLVSVRTRRPYYSCTGMNQ
jgi:hypothetical protein